MDSQNVAGRSLQLGARALFLFLVFLLIAPSTRADQQFDAFSSEISSMITVRLTEIPDMGIRDYYNQYFNGILASASSPITIACIPVNMKKNFDQASARFSAWAARNPRVDIPQNGPLRVIARDLDLAQAKTDMTSKEPLELMYYVGIGYKNCIPYFGRGTAGYIDYTRALVTGTSSLPPGMDAEFETGNDVEEYLTCMAERSEWVNNSCGGVNVSSEGDGPAGPDDPLPDGDEDLDDEDMLPDGDEDLVDDDDPLPDGDEDIPDETDDSPGGATQAEDEPSPFEDLVEDLAENSTQRGTIASGAAAMIMGVGCLMTGGGVCWGFAAAYTAYSVNQWLPDGQDCQAGYAFEQAHSLFQANYAIGGEPLGAVDMFQGCGCMFINSQDPDPRTWGCKNEAEQRRDCARNPFTDDDAPRPECIEFLYGDSGGEPPDPCIAALCPAGYGVVDTGLCTCGIDADPGTLPPRPNPVGCSQIVCGPDQVPKQSGGVCVCAPLGGFGGSGGRGGVPPGHR